MHVCPLCNGLQQASISCSNCGKILTDAGKLTDYLDDYSAYMDIDIMKLFDGVEQSLEVHQCVHLFYCSHCQQEQLCITKEI